MNITAIPPTAVLPPTQLDADQPPSQDSTVEASTSPSIRKKRGIADTRYLWPQHSTVRISLIGMSDEDKDLTKTAIKKWQPYINLKLEFVDTDDGDIRIGTQRASGGQSLRGTNAKDAPPDQPTMTVRYTNNTRETSRVIQHEFGHALGIIHEHQHPANPIQYNVPALAEMFGEQFANQEFSSYQRIMTALLHVGPDEIKLTPYDPKSIMHYHVIDNFASGGDVKAPNYELSPGDKHLAETLYPPETPRTFLIQNARTGGTQAFEWDPGAEQPPESSELPESQVPPE